MPKLFQDSAAKDVLTHLDKPHALALHTYIASKDDELTFASGDTIDLTSTIDESWLEGSCNGRTGIFPTNFVVIVKPLPDAMPTEKTTLNEADSELNTHMVNVEDFSGRICTAVADYSSETQGDLSFKAGQDIRIISTVNADWLKGVLHNKTGIFPNSFVKILDGELNTSAEAVTKVWWHVFKTF